MKKINSFPHFAHPDVRGGESPTTPHFIQFRDWIVSRAGEAADRRIVNATGGGILHGGRIAQTDFTVLHLPKSKHDLGLERRLATAWGAGAEIRRTALAALPAKMKQRDALPIATWLEFGGATATSDEIDAALSSAHQALASASAITTYLSNRCAAYDAQAQEAARRPGSHANDDSATTSTRDPWDALQARVLIDYLDRADERRAHAHTIDVVRASGQLLAGLRVLDVSCGAGLTMVPLATAGLRVDGVEISQHVLDTARQHPALAASQFFLSDGDDCGAAPDGVYDLAYAHDALPRIASRSIRRRLLHAIGRALRSGGMFFARMPFDADRDAAAVPAPHVPWQADITHSAIDPSGSVWATRDALPDILADCSEHFGDVRFQVIDRGQDFETDWPLADDALAPRSCLIITGTARGGLATRLGEQLALTEHGQQIANEAAAAGAAHQ